MERFEVAGWGTSESESEHAPRCAKTQKDFRIAMTGDEPEIHLGG